MTKDYPLSHYFQQTRTPTYSLIAIIPLIIIYELGIQLLTQGQKVILRNGADILLRQFLQFVGLHGILLLFFLTSATYYYIYRTQEDIKINLYAPYFINMFLESVIYAYLFLLTVRGITSLYFATGPAINKQMRFIISIGAGVYEEIVFRLILVGAISTICRKWLYIRKVGSYIVAIVISSLAFAAFHYIGPYGDTFSIYSFVYRFWGGAILCLIYATRGLGIAVWTHAMYDVLLLLSGP